MTQKFIGFRRAIVAVFSKKNILLLLLSFPAWATDDPGRDFPKTLIFDEPGIDDEISLPTLIETPLAAGRETDVDFELDKRLTTRLSVQINVGYTVLPMARMPAGYGWQDTDVTLKYVVWSDRAAEQLVSVSLVRELGGSGAARVGAAAGGATTGAVNFGQGFAPIAAAPLLQPFAVTGSFGFLLPDRSGGDSVREALVSASLQYSFDVLMGDAANTRLPGFLRPFIPIVEATYTSPLAGAVAAQGILAPGLIYAGDGFQVAAEALIPLTRASGAHVGAIAQLNVSLEVLGWAVLARPVF